MKPAKTKSEIRKEMEEEEESNTKFANKVGKKMKEILKKIERVTMLEEEFAKEEKITKKMEKEE